MYVYVYDKKKLILCKLDFQNQTKKSSAKINAKQKYKLVGYVSTGKCRVTLIKIHIHIYILGDKMIPLHIRKEVRDLFEYLKATGEAVDYADIQLRFGCDRTKAYEIMNTTERAHTPYIVREKYGRITKIRFQKPLREGN